MVTRLLSLSALLAAPACALGAPEYQLVDLGTYFGESHAFAIAGSLGELRMIAGSSTASDAHFRAFRFAPEFGALPPVGSLHEAAFLAMDAHGKAVGVAYDLGAMAWTAAESDGWGIVGAGPFVARGINSSGDMAGTTTVVSSDFGGLTLPRACRVSGGSVQALPTLGGSTGLGLAIDDSGRVAGSAMNTSNAASRPCLWVGLVANDLGTLGGSNGQVYALRPGSAVGASQVVSGIWHATMWNLDTGGAVLSRVDLGALGANEASVAHAMNAAGDVVGTSNFHAFLWRGGTMMDLNSLASAPGWVLETAWAIDDLGRIVGSGSLWGIPRAFLLTVACPGDLNSDSLVDDADFSVFAGAYNLLLCSDPAMPAGCPADLNADGFVDDQDFSIFVVMYNALVCP